MNKGFKGGKTPQKQTKQNKLEVLVKQLDKDMDMFAIYMAAFQQFPPQGEQARYYALQEFDSVTYKVIKKIKEIEKEVIRMVNNEK